MRLAFLAVLGLAGLVGTAPASATTYTLHDANGTEPGTYSLDGTITTDGKTGVLNLSDITNWNLTITQNVFGGAINFTELNSVALLSGSSLTATPNALFFDYTIPIDFNVSSFGFGGTIDETGFNVGYTNNGFGNFFIDECGTGDCFVGLGGPFRTGNQAIAFSDAAANTPLPAALPLFVTGLGAIGLLVRRRKRKASAFAA